MRYNARPAMAVTQEHSSPSRHTRRMQIELSRSSSDLASNIGNPVKARHIVAQEWAPALLLLFIDVILWLAIYSTVSAVRHEAFGETRFELAIVTCLQLAVIVQALYIIGGYDWHIEMRGLAYTAEHFLALIAAAVVSSFLVYSLATLSRSMHPSRGVLLASFIAFAPISLLNRRWVRQAMAARTAEKAFLVIGAGDAAVQFYQAYKDSPNRQRLEFVDPIGDRVGHWIAGQGSPTIEGKLDEKLAGSADRYSGIILAEKVKTLPMELLAQLVRAQFHTTRVYTLESFYETHWRYVPNDVVDPVWPLQTGFQLARTSPYHYLKRLFDLVASAALLIICSPLFGLIALLIWLTSGRPVLFKQERVGREGRRFTAVKFRTMRSMTTGQRDNETTGPGGEEETDDIYTRADDPRVTKLGRWLRKLRLDELPQLWNVLKADMSLIGPRAEWTKCAEQYEKNIPFYHFRHLVKPGITGWAQVNYPYGESEQDAVEKLKYDLYYIRHYSLKLDAMIVLKTIYTMLFGKGR